MTEASTVMSLQAPNIFDYAASELSQDAFICWLIKLADCEWHELHTASKEFIALLCQLGTGNKDIKAADIGNLLKPKQYPKKQYPLQQYGAPKYGKMDVFFIAEVKDKVTSNIVDTCFIIEDKVHSQPHSDQLNKYVKYVQKEHPGLPIIKIYFKTGYLYENEKKKCTTTECMYGILDYRQINNYLSSINTQDTIFTSYRDYIQRTFFNRYEEGLKSMKEHNGHLLLNNDFIQYEFLKLLSDCCRETIGPKSLMNGVSSGGDPWAHYRFIWIKDALGKGIDEKLWYRIESRKNKESGKNSFCLSLRQFSENMDKLQKVEKLNRLKIYKKLFTDISGEINDVVFAKPQTDLTGSNSSEIGLLFFNEKENSIQNVLVNLPKIHMKFVSKIQQMNNELTIKK